VDLEEDELKDSQDHEDLNLPLSKLFCKRSHKRKHTKVTTIRCSVRLNTIIPRL
jgi:hypothetical protein